MKNCEEERPMERVVSKLSKLGLDLSSMRALEVFGRKGDWHTVDYASHVSTLEVWEIESKFLEDLKKNLPKAQVKIVDSFSEVKTTANRYDLIVVDNPQSVYGECSKYCEHFEILPHIFRIANDPCVVIINVNLAPYNFHRGLSWWDRRRAFYNTDHPEKLSLDLVKRCYETLCIQNRSHMEWCFFERRNDSISYFVFKVALAT